MYAQRSGACCCGSRGAGVGGWSWKEAGLPSSAPEANSFSPCIPSPPAPVLDGHLLPTLVSSRQSGHLAEQPDGLQGGLTEALLLWCFRVRWPLVQEFLQQSCEGNVHWKPRRLLSKAPPAATQLLLRGFSVSIWAPPCPPLSSLRGDTTKPFAEGGLGDLEGRPQSSDTETLKPSDQSRVPWQPGSAVTCQRDSSPVGATPNLACPIESLCFLSNTGFLPAQVVLLDKSLIVPYPHLEPL